MYRLLKPKIKAAILLVGAIIILIEIVALFKVVSDFKKMHTILSEVEAEEETELPEEYSKVNEKHTESSENADSTTRYEESSKTIYEDDRIICIEKREEWSDPNAAHPIVGVTHHTYNKATNEEMSLLDITGKTSEELADEIRSRLKDDYPELYREFWSNEGSLAGFYVDYYKNIDPTTLDFCVKDDGIIEIYSDWGLDHATNPYGSSVYVTLKGNGI